MNGTSRTNTGFDPGDGGLDRELIRLFDEADPPSHPDAFVSAMLVKVEAARHARLMRRCIGVAVLMLAGALVAPYMAHTTLRAANWVVEKLPEAVLAIASCACAALLAWRTALRQLR